MARSIGAAGVARGAGRAGAVVAAGVGLGDGVGAGVGVGVAGRGAILKPFGIWSGIVVIGGRTGAGVGEGLACWACVADAANAAIRPGRNFPACTSARLAGLN
ncbi:hypothetical protein [Sphingomonas sp.]|uniref:hypothetical protein n=1 Tax=Sphingomonas sp. TaxID=28214 RepID=UPI002ED98C04